MNSRDKGKRGERAFAAFLNKFGFNARRGVQFQGGPESPDVVCEPLKAFHFEVKNTENLLVKKALAQAERDAPKGAIPLVVWKRNHKPWQVIVDGNQFFSLLQYAIKGGFNPTERTYTHDTDDRNENDNTGTGDCPNAR